MKNYLLLIAASLAVTSVSAQQLTKVNMADKAAKVAPATFAKATTGKFNNFVSTPSAIRRAQGTAANPTAFYKRPQGTFNVGYSDDLASYRYNFVNFTPNAPIFFKNASTNPSATTWYLGTTAMTQANAAANLDADNNFTISYSPVTISDGKLSGAYNLPTLVNAADSFVIGYAAVAFCGYQGMPFTVFPYSEGFYYGGRTSQTDNTPVAFYGDRAVTTTRNQIAFYQKYDKPVGSLTLNEITLYAWCNGGSIMDAAKDMKVYVYDLTTNSDGSKTLGDNVLATFTFEPDSVKYQDSMSITGFSSGSTCAFLTFYPMVDDGLGGQMVQPVDLTDEFAVLVTGFAGKNVGFFFGEAPSYLVTEETQNSISYDDSAAPEARFLAQDSQNNNIYDYSYNALYYPCVAIHGYQNYAHFMEDATFRSGETVSFQEYTAPAAGGYAVNDSAYAAQLTTALPWVDNDGFDNYTINIEYQDGDEPWINQHEDGTDENQKFRVSTTDWAEYGAVVLAFYADPLPAGKTGRHAVVTVVANGYTSNKIVIRQGDDKTTVADGIKGISEDKKPVNNRIYNLSGQQVDQAYKGIVIRNGKKYIQ